MYLRSDTGNELQHVLWHTKQLLPAADPSLGAQLPLMQSCNHARPRWQPSLSARLACLNLNLLLWQEVAFSHCCTCLAYHKLEGAHVSSVTADLHCPGPCVTWLAAEGMQTPTMCGCGAKMMLLLPHGQLSMRTAMVLQETELAEMLQARVNSGKSASTSAPAANGKLGIENDSIFADLDTDGTSDALQQHGN